MVSVVHSDSARSSTPAGATGCDAMRDMEWFQCGYLPRRGDRVPDDDESARLTSCFGESDDGTRPALVRVYPGGWGFAVGSSADGAVWTWGACREYLAEGAAGDGRPRRGAGRAHPASAGFATVVSCLAQEQARENYDETEVRVRVEGWCPGNPNEAVDRNAPDVTFYLSCPASAPSMRLNLGLSGVGPATRRVRHLAAGDEHFVACAETGEAFFWNKKNGAAPSALVFESLCGESLTRGDEGPRERELKKKSRVEITHVAAGSRHSALVDKSGRVWTFGWGLYGQLGHETCEDLNDPTPVEALLGVCFARAVAAGAAHTCALASTGSLYAFGSNQDGQLGVPAAACALGAATATPALVEFPWDDEDEDDERAPSSSSAGGPAFKTSTFVKEVSCGARHTACVTTQRELVSWGWNKYGQLGVGDLRTREAPTRVATEPLSGREAEAVACGRWHTVVGVARSGSARDAVRLD